MKLEEEKWCGESQRECFWWDHKRKLEREREREEFQIPESPNWHPKLYKKDHIMQQNFVKCTITPLVAPFLGAEIKGLPQLNYWIMKYKDRSDHYAFKFKIDCLIFY